MGTVVAAVALVAGVAMTVPLFLPRARRAGKTRVIAAGALVGILASLAGPTAYAVTPLSTPVQATFPSAGPSTTGPGGGPGPDGGRGMPDGTRHGGGTRPDGATGHRPDGVRGERGERSGGEQVSPQLMRYLTDHHENETWLVAVVGSMVAAPVILETGQPVMAVGGYNGNDPTPTVDELKQHIADGELRYVWTSGSSGVRSMSGDVDTAVVDTTMSWVAHHCPVVNPTDYGANPTTTTHLHDCQGTT
ncbi:hypothetical protein [Saccharopolyspora flava]|uniref:Putative mannosyltransferase YkcA/B-like C-terminal domain-containing protein n=1 Tax=Saccharopolyspora flava TaxID=95161 RepID=A0A1I6P8N5_9PSEU|nr:hypothetical protein [Saccharopolyspora flava]SFS36505.1 hypothetical protein SAMN05660874_00552 [Saccharopolyspora flava]